jgi:hypothetical protein
MHNPAMHGTNIKLVLSLFICTKCPAHASLLTLMYLAFNAGIKSLHATLPGEKFLLGILLLELCISLIYA